MIDLAGMRRVEVNAQNRIVRAEAGCLVANVDQATQRFGLAAVMGGCPTVGIGGLTLGGGIGTLTPKYGAACDNLDSAQVMTVDSRQLEATHSTNSDLFWAIRGGGGNFGVATSFQYRLYPVTEFLAGALEYPAGEISELLRIYQKFTAKAPDEIMVVAMIVSSKPVSRFVIRFRSCGDSSVGNRLLRPLREPIKPEVDTVKVMSYLEAQTTEFPQPPKPLPFFETSLFLPELNEPAIAAITTAIQDAPPRMRVMMWQMHGAVTRIPVGDSAFCVRIRPCSATKGRLGYARRRGGREAMDESSSRCPGSFFTWDVRQSLERTERQLCQGGVWAELWTAGRNQKEVRSHECARAQPEYQAGLTMPVNGIASWSNIAVSPTTC